MPLPEARHCSFCSSPINFFKYGLDVKRTGELTASFKIPYYPFCFAISLSFLFQSLTIGCDLIKTIQGGNNE